MTYFSARGSVSFDVSQTCVSNRVGVSPYWHGFSNSTNVTAHQDGSRFIHQQYQLLSKSALGAVSHQITACA